ncbi:MAG: peptide chain release factor 1 [Planctomycetota bacterium]|nr:MAG: peptide chain release factor 1 [Planctomycetota bacterium]
MAVEDRLLEKLQELDARARELEAQLARPEVAADGARSARLSQELGQLLKSVAPYRDYRALERRLREARELASADPDPEIRELAAAEAEQLAAQLEAALQGLKQGFFAADPESDKNVIVEIRAGTGGDEAALFAADLFGMYTRFAERHRLKVEVIEASPTEIGGLREVIFRVKGPGAYGLFRYESGGHRVQRVPKTESQGRIHTSMATVGVLPEVEEVEIHIDPQDLRIDTMRAGGPGGQHVNKTESAVRIVHVPTGIEVKCQSGKSQHQNRAEAMRLLRARLYQHEQQRRERERGALRRSLIGSGDRSERIRTYNFPQNRCTDHRLEESFFGLESILAGEIDEIVARLRSRDCEQRLAAL